MVIDINLNPTTITGVKNLLSILNKKPDKKRGQNFLIDQNLALKICSELKKEPIHHIIEIGGGLLSLSMSLIREGYRLTTFEIDPSFLPWYLEVKKSYNNFNYYTLDIRVALENIETIFAVEFPITLLGNLPYYLSSHLLYLLFPKNWWSTALLTLQKEVGERLMASPGSKNRSPLTLLKEIYVDMEVITELPPSVFFPQPKVNSLVIKFTRQIPKFTSKKEEDTLRKVIYSCFTQKRKTIVNSLSLSNFVKNKSLIIKLLKDANININLRAEDLTLEDYYNLTKTFLRNGITIINT